MSRRRPTWPDLPGELRRAVEGRLGAVVATWESHDAGYSPGPALTLTTAEGDRVFVKAADTRNPDSVRFHRREAEVAAALSDDVPTPRLRWSLEVVDADGLEWVALAFDAVAGRNPRVPWRPEELAAVGRLVTRVAEAPAPALLVDYADGVYDGWGSLAAAPDPGLASYDPWATANLEALAAIEATAPDAVRGDRLVHNDLRGDNVLVPDDGSPALVVDWPHARRGAAFCDLVGWLPALRLEGGPEPEEMLAAHPVGRAADPDAVTAFVVAIAGYFVHSSLQPPPPGIPHVRAFQRAQGEVCLDWLRVRLG
ncbi:phosphotransferase family enzyme [Salana multivorans]|uniref:Phosphotransferase family enzyme n=1 Tax=Salana multivorans TaxID=120377 RepID=A0A3N2D090_9MICO|nr:phosphotransferase [Salana multivorans]ROR93215.1 phosphotransferase family enzyme [Salana multivorans]